LQEAVAYVRAKYPQAEAEVKGGTGELVALGHPGTEDERWVISVDSRPDAALLGEGSTIQTAWENATKNLQSALR